MLVSSIAKKQTSANTSRIFENVYNTNNARGLFQLINLEWKFIQNCSPVLWLHVFVEPGKTMIKVVVKSSNNIDINDFNNILCSYDTKLDMIKMLKYYSHKYRYDWCQMRDINHCNILKFPPFYMAMMNVFIMFHVLICCSGLEGALLMALHAYILVTQR